MRLQLEGVDIGDRAREQARKWEVHNEDFVSLFYDGHGCFANLMAGDAVANTRLIENMREHIRDDRKVIFIFIDMLLNRQLPAGVEQGSQ